MMNGIEFESKPIGFFVSLQVELVLFENSLATENPIRNNETDFIDYCNSFLL